ncbi:MAG: DUF2237 domain-containing protein [Anaerolineales bacterium]|nr:DUF2237 domain-containing protein [Anaerolineales bacterium]
MSNNGSGPNGKQPIPLNVLGNPLIECSSEPITGFFRNGRCDTGPSDFGSHTVCAQVTAEFLEFSKQSGNDLSTPSQQFGFPGLQPGDCWCVCAPRWQEALEAGYACPVRLEATHIGALQHIDLDDLQEHAINK